MAKSSSKTDLLAQVSLFSRCSSKELKHIAGLVDEVTFPAGKVIVAEGRGGEEAFVIVSGTARVTQGDVELRTVGAGEAVGEMTLLDRTAVRSATVTTTSEVEALVIGAREFDAVLSKHPEVTRALAVGLAARLRDLEN